MTDFPPELVEKVARAFFGSAVWEEFDWPAQNYYKEKVTAVLTRPPSVTVTFQLEVHIAHSAQTTPQREYQARLPAELVKQEQDPASLSETLRRSGKISQAEITKARKELAHVLKRSKKAGKPSTSPRPRP